MNSNALDCAFTPSIDLEGEHQLILCTNGGIKNNKKEQNRDITRAKSIKAKYFAAKADPATRFTLETQT